MKLTPPKMITFIISLLLGLFGLLGQIGVIPALDPYAFWLAFIGLVLLVLGLIIKGL